MLKTLGYQGLSMSGLEPYLRGEKSGKVVGITLDDGFVNNLEQFYSSVEKLRGIATEANATVVFGHDPDQIKELRTAPEGSYR